VKPGIEGKLGGEKKVEIPLGDDDLRKNGG